MPADLPDYTSAVTSPAKLLVASGVALHAQFTNFDVNPLPGTHGIAVMSRNTSGSAQVAGVQGKTSVDSYYPSAPIPLVGQTVLMPIVWDPTLDQQLTVTIRNVDAAVDIPVDILAVLDVEGLLTVPPTNTNLPAPWQAPTLSAQAFVRGLAAAGTQQLIAAVGAGIRIYVHTIQIEVDEAAGAPANGVWVVRDGGGKVFCAMDGAGCPKGMVVPCHGNPALVNSPLNLFNQDGIAHNGTVTVHYATGA